ncbi:hypothetical protein BI335_12685 [Enemella evansiae]|uniref:hypothetical protein n=1 Tax=Enemella evansiae TaxID=2016499 RepID=UPI000B97B456|nr:hypothetical protein [Enemella evansiae]OYO14053.1 hypothetical protein BI335_12685 [Enemella evansiae]
MPQNRSRTAVLAGIVASVLAIAAVALSSDALRTQLAGAYAYPNASGMSLDDATSWTTTYLFLIFGAALLVALIYLIPRVAGSRAGWWTGAVLTVLGAALAIYNATQAFPMLIRVAGFLPVAAGLVWLSLSGSGRRTARAAAAA